MTRWTWTVATPDGTFALPEEDEVSFGDVLASGDLVFFGPDRTMVVWAFSKGSWLRFWRVKGRP